MLPAFVDYCEIKWVYFNKLRRDQTTEYVQVSLFFFSPSVHHQLHQHMYLD